MLMPTKSCPRVDCNRPSCPPANVLRSRGQTRPLSVNQESKFSRKSHWPSQLALFSLAQPSTREQSHANTVARASSPGKETVSREDISKMSITFILDLLKCTFLGDTRHFTSLPGDSHAQSNLRTIKFGFF